MTPLTVACVFVSSDGPAEFPYTADYVGRLLDMVIRWCDRPFRFVCLTDRPQGLPPGVEPLAVGKLPGFAPWTKLELFNPARRWTGRVLYLDLDTLIVAPLTPLIDAPAPFAITADPPERHKPRLHDAYGREIVRRFNSSVMVWDGGSQTDLYLDFVRQPGVVDRLSGDQDWIGLRRPHAHALPRAWFPRMSELRGQPPAPPAKVVLVKVPKNQHAARQWPWFRQLWGAA